MATLRLFVALDLPDSVKTALAALRTDIAGASWSSTANMHLTLKFLGDGIEESRVPELTAALSSVQSAPFALAVRGVGRFPPGSHQPARILWAGLDAPPALPALASAVERALEPHGFPPEWHAFAPHLTLARLKLAAGDPATEQFLEQHAGLRSEPFSVTTFHLYASLPSPQGVNYQQLASFPLTKPPSATSAPQS